MISFDEAVSLVLAAARPIEGESVGIGEAFGRVLCEPVYAQMSAPPADTSAMDGYAVRDADLETLPARLRVIGESFAGRGHDGALENGGCVRIFTGAPVPAGADRVVIQEMVRRDAELAIVESPPGKARHIRRRGSDFEAGDELLGAGRRLDYRALVAAAGADLAEVTVWRRPRLFLLSTGDELVEPGSARADPAAIPESVSFGVSALASLWGAQEVGRSRLRDDLPAMERVAAEAVGKADLVVVTGGASVGEKGLRQGDVRAARPRADLLEGRDQAGQAGLARPRWPDAGAWTSGQPDLCPRHRAAAAGAAGGRPGRTRSDPGAALGSVDARRAARCRR